MSLYASLATRGTSPALTWYDSDGRLELSGKVLANHVAKIANYLRDEFGLQPGEHVALDLPLHWKTLAWALGALVAGLEVHDAVAQVPAAGATGNHAGAAGEAGPAGPASDLASDLVVTNHPERWAESAAEVVALNLDSFAFAWNGDLPAGVADGLADVMGQPDALVLAEETDNAERARGGKVIERASVLVKPTVAEATRALLAASAGGAAIVVVGEGDPARIVAAERAQILP
ncbi:hypothetical protein HMPREF3167_07720 [Trueperella sp. HMSC08B05]|uniref:TIGR03089 family protein n=1 Tax=Trueperella sp. HMSC08B05 TaxID=1581135 RepID=UPI0008A121B3|nr:TIGR03089 family protein [Trueperella sp. HMSC08B05]OFS72577.1 hypothetical protein HMPREF3167_07720 [Trueperella sp. HMSC08B05]